LSGGVLFHMFEQVGSNQCIFRSQGFGVCWRIQFEWEEEYVWSMEGGAYFWVAWIFADVDGILAKGFGYSNKYYHLWETFQSRISLINELC